LIRDGMDDRQWCGTCYRYERVGEHDPRCCCVCHGPHGLRFANQDRARGYAKILADEIARSARASLKLMGA